MAYLFNGTNQYLRDDSVFSLSLTAHTISFWAKSTSQPGTYFYGGTDTGGAPGPSLKVYEDGATQLAYAVTDSFGMEAFFKVTIPGFFDGNWHHVVFVFTAGVVTAIYIDGVSVAFSTTGDTLSTSGTLLFHSSDVPNVMVLNDHGSRSNYRAGEFADLRHWTAALSATEAQNVYSSGLGSHVADVAISNLLDAWTLISDLTGVSNLGVPSDLVAVNSPTVSTHPYTLSPRADISDAILWPDGTYTMWTGLSTLRWMVSDYEPDVSSTLTIVQTISQQMERLRSIADSLTIDQTVNRTYQADRSISHTISIVQAIARSITLTRRVKHPIGITQPFTQGGVLPQKSVTSELKIDHFITVETELLDREIVFHVLDIQQLITTQVIRDRSITHVLDILSGNPLPPTDVGGGGGSGGNAGGGNSSRSLGAIAVEHEPAGTDTRDRPSVLADLDLDATTVTFEYPYDSPTLTLTIRAPLFGNRDELEVQRIQRYTLKNNLITHKDPDWYTVQVFRLKFDTLTSEEILDFQDFIAQSLGKPVKYTDHEGREWCVLIRNPNGMFTTKRDVCDKTAEIDLETINDA